MALLLLLGNRLTDVTKTAAKLVYSLKICFMTATYTNYEVLRAAFPTIEIGVIFKSQFKSKT